MKRLPLYLLPLVCLLALAAHTAPLPAAERQASVRYVLDLQNQDGGFRGAAESGPSQLGATSSSLRALKYFGGSVPRRREVQSFVLSCYDAASGGFAETPGGTPDVRSTAMGLMAMAELKLPLQERGERARDFLTQKAVSVPEIYIAAAALDTAGLRTHSAPFWIARFDTARNGEGLYGSPLDSATAVITTVRLGGTFDRRDAVLASLRSAQRPDGGFAGTGDASDLGATYRMMRAFHLLKAVPDLAGVRRYVGACRNADGGYGAAPGQPSNGSATYFAGIILRWSDELEGG
jgi:prenyltransferase beta subunit